MATVTRSNPDGSTDAYDLSTSVYTRTLGGVVVQTRPFTAGEQAWAAALNAKAAQTAQIATIRAQIAAGVAAMAAAQAQAQADVAAANALKTQADGLAVTGSTVEIRNIAAAISQLAAWRAAVDQNAVLTDNALIGLAQIASAQLDQG